jgi:4-amino-4-deoxy-L-arabinose transferase-like glycosyltransferase
VPLVLALASRPVGIELVERKAPDTAARPERRSWDRARDAVRADPALTVIVVVAIALRLGWVLAVRTSAPPFSMLLGDQDQYYYYGREIAEGHGYVSHVTNEPTAYYPIGFPAILAALFWVVRTTPLPDDYMLAANVLNVVVGTASVVLAYLIGRRLFGRIGGLLGAAILAVFPNLVYQVASVQLETMFIFWCLAAVAIIVVHDWSRGLPPTRRLLAFGLVLGVSVLIRPFSIWFIGALFVAALVARAGWVRSLRVAAIPLAVVALMSVPWTIRNAIRMDAFIPTSTNTGDTLCLDRSLDATGGFRFAEHEGCADPDLPEVERNRASTRMAIEFVIDHPARELQQIGRRARLMFESDHDGVLAVNTLGGGQVIADDTSAVLEDIADVAFYVVTVLAGAGLVVLIATRRRRRPETALVLLSMGALIAVPLLLWGNPRFHLPFSPFLAILAGGAVATSVEMLQQRRSAAGAGRVVGGNGDG